MEAILERTTKEDQLIARDSISAFHEFSEIIIGDNSRSVNIKIGETSDFLLIPKKAFSLLTEILDIMAEGKSVTLIPSDSEVSTQQAADMLNVSRPHLVSLLEKGEIPFTKVGTHRRIALIDLMDYEKRLKQNRKEKMKFLAEQAQELNLDY